jgi:hypothetical protein
MEIVRSFLSFEGEGNLLEEHEVVYIPFPNLQSQGISTIHYQLDISKFGSTSPI